MHLHADTFISGPIFVYRHGAAIHFYPLIASNGFFFLVGSCEISWITESSTSVLLNPRLIHDEEGLELSASNSSRDREVC